jgi:tripeptidyl-peptidase-1
MALVTAAQDVTLYQVGDIVESLLFSPVIIGQSVLMRAFVIGASFNNLFDALDGFYCSSEGGDDPLQDAIYPDPASGGYKGAVLVYSKHILSICQLQYVGKDCGTVKPANVISTSYSYNEADLTPAYTARQCAEYAKLGLMGVTVLYASGDNGVAGGNNICLNPDGSQSGDGQLFNPSFPGTCPYITSVGATQGAQLFPPPGQWCIFYSCLSSQPEFHRVSA